MPLLSIQQNFKNKILMNYLEFGLFANVIAIFQIWKIYVAIWGLLLCTLWSLWGLYELMHFKKCVLNV